MEERNTGGNRAHSDDYYRQRAIRRKRERAIKKRRRKIVAVGLLVLVVIIALLVSMFNCIGSCIGSGDTQQVSAAAQTEQSEPTAGSAAGESTQPTSAATTVDTSYFDDAVFVGDSVTMSFSMYVDSQRSQGIDCLGDAYILSAGSLSYTNSLLPVGDPNCVLPVYQGVQQPLEDSIAQIGAKKVYIMLGVNEIGGYDMDVVMENVDTVLNNILEKSPDAKIYIQSVTPRVKSTNDQPPDIDTIRTFNERMKAYAEEHGHYYLDIYSAMADEEGFLKEEYCSDPDSMGIHFTMEADAKWEEYLLSHSEGK